MTRFTRGEIISGKYRIERTLAEGGASSVFLARHVDLGQQVAIKLLRAEPGARSVAAERFKLGARAAARLQGTHVCRVLDIDTQQDGAPLVVMEYLEGRHLGQELEQRGPLSVGVAVRCVLEACDALGAAHAAGIMHCDLKPANLFWAKQPDGSREIKVIGFGVPKVATGPDHVSAALSVTSSAVSSPAYMAPEQLDATLDIDERADVWALGVVLYELIAGRPPFQGESLPALVSAVLNGRVRPLSELRAGVPAELDDVIIRALRKRREQRYGSVTELVAALLPFAELEGAVLDDVHSSRAAVSGAATSGERTHRGTSPREQQITRSGAAHYGMVAAALLLLGVAGVLAVRYLGRDAVAGAPRPTETVLHGSREPLLRPAPVVARPAGVVASSPLGAAASVEPAHVPELPLGQAPPPVAPKPAPRMAIAPARTDTNPALPAHADKPALAKPEPPSLISDFGGRR